MFNFDDTVVEMARVALVAAGRQDATAQVAMRRADICARARATWLGLRNGVDQLGEAIRERGRVDGSLFPQCKQRVLEDVAAWAVANL